MCASVCLQLLHPAAFLRVREDLRYFATLCVLAGVYQCEGVEGGGRAAGLVLSFDHVGPGIPT